MTPCPYHPKPALTWPELQVGKDSRPVMRAVEAAFKAGSGTGSMEAAAIRDATGSRGDLFYSLLYQGLYLEAEGDAAGSKAAMLQSLDTPYVQSSGDYMCAVARVHCLRRDWLWHRVAFEEL